MTDHEDTETSNNMETAIRYLKHLESLSKSVPSPYQDHADRLSMLNFLYNRLVRLDQLERLKQQSGEPAIGYEDAST